MSEFLTDLRLVVAVVLGATVATLVPGVPWQVEWLFGLPLLVFAPGYAAVAAVFPERPAQPIDGHRSPGWPARAGLSLVVSALVVAVVGVVLASQVVVSLTLVPAVLTIGGVTILFVALASGRRSVVPAHRQGDPLRGRSFGAVTDGFGTSGGQSLALIASVVVLAGALTFAGTAAPTQGYTETYLTGGEGVDVGPDDATLVAETENTMALAVQNKEGEWTDYRIITRLQDVEDGTVLAQERLDRVDVGLSSNESQVTERSLEPTLTGERLRLQVLVYKGSVPDEPGPDTADLSLRRWVTVTDEGSA